MPKFQKKPVVIEAVQYDGTDECARRIGLEITVTETGIQTLEGFMRASPGDWIITGVKGERYPCKPDVFEATYAPVADAPKPGPTTDDTEGQCPSEWSIGRCIRHDGHEDFHMSAAGDKWFLGARVFDSTSKQFDAEAALVAAREAARTGLDRNPTVEARQIAHLLHRMLSDALAAGRGAR